MLRYLVRRLLLLVPILFGVSLLIFFWIHALPGSPAESLLGERATPQLVEVYRHRYGLDKPVYVQYWSYLKTTASGDLGVSVASRRRVIDEIKVKFPATVELALAAMLFAISIGVPLGFLAAKWHGGVFDNVSLVASLIGISIPIFFLAIITRITRAAVLDVQNEDYVRTARAKGLPPQTVDRRHVLRNALLPVTTVIGLQTGLLLSGAVLTETIFAYPGMGSWLRDAIFNRDYPVLQGGILFLAVVFVFVNLIVDLSYAFINPRIRYS